MRGGVTLVELIVSVAILSLLVGLLLPAVQKARETASRIRCANNLRQLGVAAHAHEAASGHFPTGGWGWQWVGDPDRGVGPRQPGGWLFNLLPYVEQNSLHGIGSGAVGPDKEVSNRRRVGIPVDGFNCPSRRGGGPYPNPDRTTYHNAGRPDSLARADYAANSGDQETALRGPGPPTLADGDRPQYPWPDTSKMTGVVFPRSTIRFSDITNGTSLTYFAGEKYIDSKQYDTGNDLGDNENAYVGFDTDVNRVTVRPPRRDEPGKQRQRIFGSTHPSGVNMLYCDGSVRLVDFTVDPAVHRRSGNRH